MKKINMGSIILLITGGLSTIIQLVPDAMMQAWMFLPEELKASIPPLAVKWVTYSIFVSSVLSKLYKARQEKKQLKQELDHARLTNTILAVGSGDAGGNSGTSGVRQDEEDAGTTGRETQRGESIR